MDERYLRQILNQQINKKMKSEQKQKISFLLKKFCQLCYVHSSLEESNEMLFAQTQNTQRFYRNWKENSNLTSFPAEMWVFEFLAPKFKISNEWRKKCEKSFAHRRRHQNPSGFSFQLINWKNKISIFLNFGMNGTASSSIVCSKCLVVKESWSEKTRRHLDRIEPFSVFQRF